MAKNNKRPDLPFELPVELSADSATAQAVTEEVQPSAPEEQFAEIRIPLAPTPEREFQIHIDTTLQGEQATTLRRIAAALDRRGAKLKGGARVTSATQAMRYILEQLTP